MTIEEIKAKLPEASVYELRSDCKYIIVLDPTFVTHKMADQLCDSAKLLGLPVFAILFVTYPDEAIRLFEMKEVAS